MSATSCGPDDFEAYVRTKDPAIRDRIVEAHLRLASYLARRFANRGQPLEDLTQVASLGLLKAVERFDPAMGLEFSTYATTTIVGELKRHLRDRGWAVKAPRRMQELYLSLGTVLDSLTQQLGRSPTIPELAEAASVSEEEVLDALEAGQAYRFASLDSPSPDPDLPAGPVASLGGDDPEMERVELRASLERLLSALPPQDQEVVRMKFFEGRTQAEIARQLGVSQMQVSRSLNKSVAALRALAIQGAHQPQQGR